MIRTALRPKRDTPRRSEGRIQHVRIKRKAGDKANAAERAHMERIAAMGCLICKSPAQVHHLTSDGHKRITRCHGLTIPLCLGHHATMLLAIHKIGHAAFETYFCIDLTAWAEAAWAESGAMR